MAIDPQIALGVQAPVIQNPVDTQEKFENVQAQAEARKAIADQRNQQTQALIQKARDQAAINAALQRNNGDLRGAGDDLTQGGYGTLGQGLYEQYTQQQQKLAAATEATTKAHQAQLDLAAKIIGSIDPAHPEQYGPAVKAFKATLTDPADIQAMNQIAPDNANPADVPGIVDRLNKMQIGAKALFDQHSKYVDGFLKGEYTPNLAGVLAITPQADRANALKMLTAQVPDYQTAQALQQQFLPLLNAPPNVIWQAGMTPEQRAAAANQAQTRADVEAAQAEAKRHNLAMEARPVAGAAQGKTTGLSDDSLDILAKQFLKTGQIPSLGMGGQAAADKQAVINRAAELGAGTQLALNSADYKANSASLKNLQGTIDSMESFSAGAGKNLKMALDLAEKIPDTGVPWANAPIRTLNQKLLGDSDQAGFEAARDTALREIAKVTSNPRLTGQLSDSQRAEVQALMSPDMTLGQFKETAKVLLQDMENVHSGAKAQANAIRQRIGGGSSQPDSKDPMGIRKGGG